MLGRIVKAAKDKLSVRNIVVTALITCITTGTFQYLSDQALNTERQYWEKYRQGAEQKKRWWDEYIRAISRNCGQ
jgi:hypothetical protein